MSKASQHQTTTSRDRTPVPPRPKQSVKGEGSGNGAKPAPLHREGANSSSEEYAIVPQESAEDDFFARGEINSSFPPAALDVIAPELEEDLVEITPLTPAQLERRARLRRIVGAVVGAAAVLTAVVGAKALAAPQAKVRAAEGALNVPHQVVASIAMAAPEEPTPAQTGAPEQAPAADPAVPPALDTAPAAENPGANEGEPSAKPGGESVATEPTPSATTRRLPVIDVEIPASNDPATDKQWESAAKNLASQDFKGADGAFAELSKRGDPATREVARLARALWWTANGRENEVKPVLADLAANAISPSVRQRARERIRAN